MHTQVPYHLQVVQNHDIAPLQVYEALLYVLMPPIHLGAYRGFYVGLRLNLTEIHCDIYLTL